MRDIYRGEVICPVCGHVQPSGEKCRYCGSHLYHRKPNAIFKGVIYSLTAFAFLIPANLLPIMAVVKLGKVYSNTIIGGIISFLEEGDYFIAIVIFVASVLIPFLKLFILWFLFGVAKLEKWKKYRKLATNLYKFISFIGKYSMLDVFVVVLMVSFIQFGNLAEIKAGPAVIPFGLAVIFTILATEQFDPKLLWDKGGGKNERS